MDHSEIFKEASHISKTLNNVMPHVEGLINKAKEGMTPDQLKDFTERINRTGVHDKIKNHNENMQAAKAQREAHEKMSAKNNNT